jgi:hypothetical protein
VAKGGGRLKTKKVFFLLGPLAFSGFSGPIKDKHAILFLFFQGVRK